MAQSVMIFGTTKMQQSSVTCWDTGNRSVFSHTSPDFSSVSLLNSQMFYQARSEQTRFKKECYLIRQDNTIYKCLITLSHSSIEQDKSKLQKQISKLLILIRTADCQFT